METLKLFSIDIKVIQKRTKLVNPELLETPELKDKNLIGVCGHLFNWEWLVGVRHLTPQNYLYAIYHPLKSTFWNDKVKQSRAIAGSILLSSFDTKGFIQSNPNDGQSFYLFISDQSPAVYKKPKAVINFLNQATAVLTGWEEITIENAFNVVYVEPIFIKLGHYKYRLHHIKPDNPEGFKPMELITKYHHLLEQSILNQPFNYLWSHKKWKHNITDSEVARENKTPAKGCDFN
jgi:KDO2-lipid IV(A) lauroyltransferase